MMTQLKRKTTAVAAALALTALAAVPVPLRAAPEAPSPLSMPVTGAAPGGTTFSGVFALTSFAVQNGQVVALGTVSGILKTAAGATSTSVSNVAVPVLVGQTTCEILHLD